MNADLLRWNLVFAWGWILLGFVSGILLGLFSHNADWLGGYAPCPRRMLRLGHISFFGLGAANLCFVIAVRSLEILTAIERMQSRGITVNGCFILGLDGDTPAVFDEVFRFVRESALYEVQITLLTAFPGTPLYRRLKAEGRILRGRAWELGTLFDHDIQPRGINLAELQRGFLDLAQRLYGAEETDRRRRLLPFAPPRSTAQSPRA